MTQIFNNDFHNKFKKYFKIKELPWKNDKELFEKTYTYINYIKWIPWIKFIWVWNSTSMFASKETSDIDLFIITTENRLWFVRILITFIFQLLWVRKNAKNHEKRFCLSFFSTLSWMNFKTFALEKDIYLYFRIVYLKPILNYDNTFEKFISSQDWADFSMYENEIQKNKNFIQFSWNSFWNNCKFFDVIDKLFKKIFLPKTIKNFEKLNKPYWIIINDNLLKFHDNDQRKEIKNKLLD